MRVRALRRRAAGMAAVVAIAFAFGPVAALAASPTPGPTSAGTSGDWPQVGGGAARAGYNAGESVLSPSTVANLGIAWRAELPGGARGGSPVVAGGVVYTTAGDGKLYAFAVGCATAGSYCTPLWVGSASGKIVSDPAVSDGFVFVGSDDRKLDAFAVGCGSGGATCTPTWTAEAFGEVWSAPAVSGGRVFVATYTGVLHAFDAAGLTGCAGSPRRCTPIWTAFLGAEPAGLPAVADGMVFVALDNGTLQAYPAECAEAGGSCPPTWTATLSEDDYPAILAGPAVADGVVYVGGDTFDKRLYAFGVHCGTQGQSCSPLWVGETGERIWTRPTVAGGKVYVGGNRGMLSAFAVGCASGGGKCRPVWSAAMGDGIESAAAVGNGVLFVGSDDQKLYAFPTSCATGQGDCAPLWTAETGGPLWSSPAVARGAVYVCSGYVGSRHGVLYAFDTASRPAPTSSPTYRPESGAGDWPQFRGNAAHTGQNPGEHALDASNVGYLAVKWTADIGTDYWTEWSIPHWTAEYLPSSPVVAGGSVYVGSIDGHVYAFAVDCPAHAGRCPPAWTARAELFMGETSVYASPAVGGGYVYVASYQTTLGAERLPGAFTAYPAGCGADSSVCQPAWIVETSRGILGPPAFADGVVYVVLGGTLNAFPVDCRPLSGTCSPLWTAELSGWAPMGSPAVADGRVYVAAGDGAIEAFAVGCATGGGACSPLWTASIGTTWTSPAVSGGVVYAGSDEGFLYAFDADCATDGSVCQPLWKATTGGPVRSSPAIADGLVYVGSDSGKLYAFAVGCASGGATCKPLWSAQVGSKVRSSPAVADGVVYVGSSDGHLQAFAARCATDGGTCSPLWTFTADGSFDASPAISDGVLYATVIPPRSSYRDEGSQPGYGVLYAFAPTKAALVETPSSGAVSPAGSTSGWPLPWGLVVGLAALVAVGAGIAAWRFKLVARLRPRAGGERKAAATDRAEPPPE